jgi:hypothetical protein
MSVVGQGRLCIRLHSGGLFLREGVDVAVEGGAGGASYTTPASEVVVRDFGLPRWWRRGSLFLEGGPADMAADAAGHTPVSLCGGGLPEGPRYGTASWGCV